MRLLTYWIQILFPLIGLVLLTTFDLISPIVFVSGLFVYSFVYRTFIDAQRLLEQGAIEKKDRWTLAIPFRRVRYFKQLYFTL